MEGPNEVQGGFAQVEALDCGPEVDDVALDAAARLEAVEDVLVELDAERLACAVRGVDGTGALALAARAAQRVPEVQVFQDTLKR